MPNWCINELTVTGPEEALKDFYEQAKGESTDLSFDKFFPTPPDLLDGNGWYDWRINNWGTKWDVEASVQGTPEEGKLLYTFASAWSPPINWLAQVAVLYPELSFHMIYIEEGIGFAGKIEFSNGTYGHSEIHQFDEEGYREFVIEHFGEDYLNWEEE